MSELKRLANLLQIKEGELSFLETLNTEQLQFLHASIDNAIYLHQSPLWEGLAKATNLLPDRLNAKIAMNFMGAAATAQLSYHLPPQKAVKVANHFSTPFMAEVVTHTEPKRAEALIRIFPQDKVEAIALYLLQQKNYESMGMFLDFLSPAQSIPVLKKIHSDEAILRIASHAQNKKNLGIFIAELTNPRILSLLQKTNELNMWDDVQKILIHLPPAQQKELSFLISHLREDEVN